MSDIYDIDYDFNDSFYQFFGNIKRSKLISKYVRVQEEDEEVVSLFSFLFLQNGLCIYLEFLKIVGKEMFNIM